MDSQESEKQKLVCPTEEDEPTFNCRLFGSSYSLFVELSGWSSFITLKLGESNLNPTTKFAKMVDETSGKIHPSVVEWLTTDLKINIRRAHELIGSSPFLNVAIKLQIVAKRSVQVVIKNRRVLLIPTLIAADDSGFCMLTSMNEGLKVVYNALDVGDVVMLTRFQPLKPRDAVHRHLFASKMFIDLEIKFQAYTARSSYCHQFNPKKTTITHHFKMPENLFDESFKLLMPAEVEPILIHDSLSGLNYFELLGVITYVGRVERYRVANNVEVESVDKKIISLPKYILYRWIKLTDSCSKPLPVRIYLSNQSLEMQDLIVPGMPVVISHCKVKLDPYSTCSYVATSEFSHIFIQEKLTSYFRQRPLWFWEKAKAIFNKVGYVNLLSRDDLFFTIGGTLHATGINEQKFLSMYATKKNFLHHGIQTKMIRRESRVLFIEAKILRVYKVVSTRNSDDLRWIEICDDDRETSSDKQSVSKLHQPVVRTWFSFIRALPQLSSALLEQPKSRMICNSLATEFQKFSGPLTVPSKKTAWGDLEHLADLTAIDGPPFLEVDLFKEESCTEWRCTWKHTGSSIEDRICKLKSASGKSVVALLEVFCLEQNCPLEITLIDFFVKP